MTKAYKYAIVYFLLFSLLLVISGIMLFEHKIGFSIQGVSEYYLGSEEKFIVAKSSAGVLKIVLPHIFAFALFSMVLLHFLIFTKHRDTAHSKALIYLLFSSAALEIFSPFMILLGAEFFVFIKIASFVLFESLVIYIAWLLLNSIIKD